MNFTQIVLAGVFLFTAAQSFAHGDKNGPCKAYETTCKADPSVTGAADKAAKWKAMKTCVTNAATADTANGKACLDAQAMHKGHHGAEHQD